MKLALLSLLPIAAMAFSPSTIPVRTIPILRPSIMNMNVDSTAEKITSTTEEYVGKADNLVLSRAMRVVDHVPLLITLRKFTKVAGISVSGSGITSNPGVFGGLATALSVPTWCFNIWSLIAISQAASAAKSILSSDGNELSQADITAATATNIAATRVIGSAAPLRDTLVLATVSAFTMRNGSSTGSLTLKNASTQLTSSFTTVLAALGIVSFLAPKIPIIGSNVATTNLLGVAAMYIMATRSGNGVTKLTVNASILAGMMYAAVSGGLSISASFASILSNLGLVGLAYTAYLSINSARKAII